jgi:hypothetical protein
MRSPEPPSPAASDALRQTGGDLAPGNSASEQRAPGQDELDSRELILVEEI